MSSPEEIKAEYTSSLADLTFNSKPLINVLTMLAEENMANAKVIVEAIETHLSKVTTDVKLPILYLIDCIVKNVAGTYTPLFSQNIVSTFCGVFKAVDEKTRAEMFKLRQTWNDIFPQMKLYAIDVQINLLDPAWPVTAKPPPTSIHLNPKFLKSNTPPMNPVIEADPVKALPTTGIVDKQTLEMHEKLIQKQKELLELQQKKLELEVLQTKVKLQEQLKSTGPNRPQRIILKPEMAKHLVPNLKQKPAGIEASLQRPSGLTTDNTRAPPPAVANSKPIRDPRLLRQQQKQAVNSNTQNNLAQKNSSAESNKQTSNKTNTRKIRGDPRTKDEVSPNKGGDKSRNRSSNNSSPKTQKSPPPHVNPRNASSDSSSLKSSSGSSLDSPKRNKTDKVRSPPKIKIKKYRNDDKPSEEKDRKTEKVSKEDVPKKVVDIPDKISDKRSEVKSREAPQDEDLRSFAPPEKQQRMQNDDLEDKGTTTIPTSKGMDVDLRQLPVIGKKRPPPKLTQHGGPKKSKSDTFDKLFGDEDTDLRQMPIKPAERPPTPPPPIISSNDAPAPVEKPPSPKTNLEVLRTKLANATNREKIMSKSFKKKVSDKVEVPKPYPNKIIISQEDESSIKSGTLTEEHQKTLLNKIVLQMELSKLKEAKQKDREESLNTSLQPISDDEFVDSDDDNPQKGRRMPDLQPLPNDNIPMRPLRDKDERFFPKEALDQPRWFPGSKRGPREGRGHWVNQGLGPPRATARPWDHMNHWKNLPPSNIPPPLEDEDTSDNFDSNNIQLTNGAVNQDEIKSINIDGAPKDIRFYNETAIAFVNWDDPREITFQDEGTRGLIFNEKESYQLGFNEPYKELLISGSPHMVRIGAPSREIFIDQIPYECYFGSPGIRIELDGIGTTVRLEGPPPQVKIGECKRNDLVAGKINLFIDAKIVVPVFLDAKVQKFVVNGETNTLKFVNALETVLINDIPFKVEYGGLPKPILIHGKKHFIRFSVLPKGILPGKVIIKDMEGTQPMQELTNIPSDGNFGGPPVPAIENIQQNIADFTNRNSSSPSLFQNLLQQQSLNNLDVLSNTVATSLGPNPNTDGYQLEHQNAPSATTNEEPAKAASLPPPLNINDLFQKLVASGFVTSAVAEKTNPIPTNDPPPPQREEPKAPPTKPPQPAEDPKPKRKRNLLNNLKPVTFAKTETLKVRQHVLYQALYSGMQCSSCGMRFSPEASMQYSQHLDWHFRQNRRGKKNIRVAANRRWYYDLADWKNYEELEDLEEREKNFFDQQQQQAEGANEEQEEEVEIPSVPADSESTDEKCEVCSDKFDQFFNEETEEWHLNNAIRIEEKTYHPVCYEDYQRSLQEQASKKEEEKTEKAEHDESVIAVDNSELQIVIDDDDEELSQENSEPTEIVSLEDDDPKPEGEGNNEDEVQASEMKDVDDDDDVILNEAAPIKIVVDDDDDEDETARSDSPPPTRVKTETIDDGFVEVAGLVSLQNGGQIKIKAEPMDDDLMVVPPTTQESATVQENKDSQEEPAVEEVILPTTTHSDVHILIDGNTDVVSRVLPNVVNSGISGNRIKINISKHLPVINNNENDNVEKESDLLTTDTSTDVPETFAPGDEPEPSSVKPVLQEVELKRQPLIRKGAELTGLCSIM